MRTSAGRLAVLKYTRSERSRGSTPWEAHWTARDHDQGSGVFRTYGGLSGVHGLWGGIA